MAVAVLRTRCKRENTRQTWQFTVASTSRKGRVGSGRSCNVRIVWFVTSFALVWPRCGPRQMSDRPVYDVTYCSASEPESIHGENKLDVGFNVVDPPPTRCHGGAIRIYPMTSHSSYAPTSVRRPQYKGENCNPPPSLYPTTTIL